MNFPPLTASQKSSAIRLDIVPMPDIPGFVNTPGWDNWANYSVNRQASIGQVFVVTLKQGATYDIGSTSWYDPYDLLVFDANGGAIAADSGAGSYGEDYIFGFKAPYSGTFYIDPSWHQSIAQSLKGATLAIYENVDTIPKPVVTEQGTAGVDSWAIAGKKAASVIKVDGQTVTLSKSGQADRKYVSVERLSFDDGWVATDIQGNAGKAYRLYEAAFNSKPDASGLGYWINALDYGVSLQSVAEQFAGSKEFGTLFGTQLSDKAYVSALYTNVLNRQLDQTGADYWTTALGNGVSRAQILIDFSESTENQQAVIGAIQNGIHYDKWV
jgi:hypothetical protein